MKDNNTLEFRISSLIQYLRQYYEAIDLSVVFYSNDEFDRRLRKYFSNMFMELQKADEVSEALEAVNRQSLFRIDTDINDIALDWSKVLVDNVKEYDSRQVVNDYLARFNPQIFNIYSSNISLLDVSLLWSLSFNLQSSARKFLALLILYLLTKAFCSEVSLLDDKLRSVESFFYIRDYLVNGADYPYEFIQSNEFIDSDLKSLLTQQELHIVHSYKALTAAGGVATSIQREDLEGKNKKKEEKSEKKRYNRIEKLEDD